MDDMPREWGWYWRRPLFLMSCDEHSTHRVYENNHPTPGGLAGRLIADCPTEEAARAALRLMLLETNHHGN